ncbi:MAG: lipid A deacylase LpxR family protein [Planctomycetes bacterium]|nr:lipid A deacylase LpxR family protein [Planctomycetota bacterium]
MRHRRSTTVWIALVSFSVAACHSSSPSSGLAFEWFVENDARVLGGPTDRYYTNAVRLAITGERSVEGQGSGAPLTWLDALMIPSAARASVEANSSVERRWAWFLGHHLYTPSDIHTKNPPSDDRPYAGWLYSGIESRWVALGNESGEHDRAATVSVSLGLVGPDALGESVQNGFHDLIEVPHAEGWSHQLHDEPTLQITSRYQERVARSTRDGFTGDVICDGAWAAGNVFANVSLGSTARFGYGLQRDFATHQIDPSAKLLATLAEPGSPPDRLDWGAHVFIGAEGRAVAHNMLLSGNNFRSSAGVDAEPFVGDLRAGVSLRGGPAELVYMQTIRSEEFESQDGSQRFWTVHITWRFSE